MNESKALVEAGWITRTEGRGRGNRAVIIFQKGSNVVPLLPRVTAIAGKSEPEKGGTDAPQTTEEKGARMHFPIIRLNQI